MSPEYVCPCVKAQKNDGRDAEGVAEAASRLWIGVEKGL